MATIRIKVSDNVLHKLIWLLGQFKKEEVEIIPEEGDFQEAKTYVQTELQKIDDGKTSFISLEELREDLDALLSRYEA